MTTRADHPNAARDLPKARVSRGRRFSLVWLVPLAALGFIGWLLYRSFIQSGPEVTIQFEDGKGIEAGKTSLRYRGVKIGDVNSVDLTKDQHHVEVKARLSGSAAGIAAVGSLFWIVRPEVSLAGISGLQTIVSGNYIQVEPGHGARTNHFIGLEQTPVLTGAEGKDLKLTLLTAQLRSVGPGTPVFYRGVRVGDTGKNRLSEDAQTVEIDVYIRPQFAPLVRKNSRFWNSGGINVNLGLFSARASASSMETLLTGGIAFATPNPIDDPAPTGTAYRLYEKAEDEWLNWAPKIMLNSGRTNSVEEQKNNGH